MRISIPLKVITILILKPRSHLYFTTTTTINACYKLIEFTPHHNLDNNFKVDTTPKQNTEEYDIIIRQYIIQDLGVGFKLLTVNIYHELGQY